MMMNLEGIRFRLCLYIAEIGISEHCIAHNQKHSMHLLCLLCILLRCNHSIRFGYLIDAMHAFSINLVIQIQYISLKPTIGIQSTIYIQQ